MDRRLFLGIAPDEATSQQLRRYAALAQERVEASWIPEESWHITQYFFGAVQEEVLPNLRAMLRLIIRPFQPFGLEFEAFALAPPGRAPRMVWAQYRKQPDFRLLSSRIDEAYRPIQPLHQAWRSPLPHLTLARLQAPPARPLPYPEAGGRPGRLPVRELILWESELRPEGSVYTPLDRYRLG
ncbi:MAG: RNA 2',3'-cyclic phosphodiesterase [Bacteroidia bacterium]|nr:RNA 2',3'-cyclic phosphodiesterase [Bacteroidia bacterium]